MKKILSILLCALLIAALLSGCGGSSKSESSYAREDAYKATSGAGASYAAESSAGWVMDAAEPEAPAMMEAKAETRPGSNLPANVKLIYRANIDMESTEFDKAVEGLNELVARMGGYYENSELNNYASYRRGYYVVRVPAENFDAFCSAVGELCQVNNLSRSAEDVSERYYDLESRLATQQTKLARLQELMKQAEDMEDIITLESAISETELAIEQLTGSLRKYDSLVGYSTISISLAEVYKLTDVTEPAIGFGAKLGQAFRSGASRFVSGLERFLLGIASGWIGWLIFIILVVVVILIVRKIRRKRAAARAVPPPAAPQQGWQTPPPPPQNAQTPPQNAQTPPQNAPAPPAEPKQ